MTTQEILALIQTEIENTERNCMEYCCIRSPEFYKGVLRGLVDAKNIFEKIKAKEETQIT